MPIKIRTTNIEDTKEYQIGYKVGFEDGTKAQNEAQYSKGSEDARQTLLNLLKIPSGEWGNMFDRDSYYVEAIFKHYSINEIAERIKAYEEKKKAEEESIKVGDEVLYGSSKLLVTSITNHFICTVNADGKVDTWRATAELIKTGRHFDEAEQLLDKLRGKE